MEDDCREVHLFFLLLAEPECPLRSSILVTVKACPLHGDAALLFITTCTAPVAQPSRTDIFPGVVTASPAVGPNPTVLLVMSWYCMTANTAPYDMTGQESDASQASISTTNTKWRTAANYETVQVMAPLCSQQLGQIQ
jgi:hypothetical protein